MPWEPIDAMAKRDISDNCSWLIPDCGKRHNGVVGSFALGDKICIYRDIWKTVNNLRTKRFIYIFHIKKSLYFITNAMCYVI